MFDITDARCNHEVRKRKVYTTTARLPETRLISESRSEMLRLHRVSVLLQTTWKIVILCQTLSFE